MKPLRSFLLVALMMPVIMLHAQEDYLAQARKFLDAGKCQAAQTYYDLALKHQLNNRRDNDIEKRIEECLGTNTDKERSGSKGSTASSLPQRGEEGGDHEYVDLGLPSGTLWATCNVGADKPEDYGDYYAWAETTTKSSYKMDTYKYINGDHNKLTKYCNKSDFGDNGFTDNLTILQAGDDPAAVCWGAGWCTPTKAQWEELKQNTTSQWTTRNGVEGFLFTSKKNGQSLFLPAAGGRWDGELYGTGSFGYYWSRSLSAGGTYYAWNLYFTSDDCYLNGNNRYYGFSVRPVREK